LGSSSNTIYYVSGVAAVLTLDNNYWCFVVIELLLSVLAVSIKLVCKDSLLGDKVSLLGDRLMDGVGRTF